MNRDRQPLARTIADLHLAFVSPCVQPAMAQTVCDPSR
jgi:hypothetical protein